MSRSYRTAVVVVATLIVLSVATVGSGIATARDPAPADGPPAVGGAAAPDFDGAAGVKTGAQWAPGLATRSADSRAVRPLERVDERVTRVEAVDERVTRVEAVDERVTRVAVEPDGDARWTVELRTRLASEDDLDRYRAFQRTFRNDTARYLEPFDARIRRTIDDASNATGREMTASNVSATTRVEDGRWGVVAFSFRWSNFARRTDGRVVVGDVFGGGLALGENDSLVIAAPAGYGIRTADPAPGRREPGVVRWSGQRTFADGRPRVVLRPGDSRTASPRSPGGATAGGAPGAVPVALGGGVVLLVVVVVAVRRGAVPGRDAEGPADGENG